VDNSPNLGISLVDNFHWWGFGCLERNEYGDASKQQRGMRCLTSGFPKTSGYTGSGAPTATGSVVALIAALRTARTPVGTTGAAPTTPRCAKRVQRMSEPCGIRAGVKMNGAIFASVCCVDTAGTTWDVEPFVWRQRRRWWGRRYSVKVPIQPGESVRPGERIGITVLGVKET
jgi:hypothetical protein